MKPKIKPYKILFVDNVMQTHRAWSDNLLERQFAGRYSFIENDILTLELRFVRTEPSRSSTWFIFEDVNGDLLYSMSASHFEKLFKKGLIEGRDIKKHDYYFSKVGNAYTLAAC